MYNLENPCKLEKLVLYIIRGLPGSGKSTLARKLARGAFTHFEADQYFITNGVYTFDPSKIKEAHQRCQDRVREKMADPLCHEDLAVSNTFTQKLEYEPYIDMAEEFGYEVCIIECHGPWKNIHGCPDEAVERMRSRWEPTIDPLTFPTKQI